MRLLVASAAWVAGGAIALQWHTPLAAAGLFLVASGTLGLLFWLRKWNLLLPVAVSLMLLGMLRVGVTTPPSEGLQPWIGVTDLQVEGTVLEDPEARGSAVRFRFRVWRISSGDGWLDVTGDVLVTTRPSDKLVRERKAPYIRYGRPPAAPAQPGDA